MDIISCPSFLLTTVDKKKKGGGGQNKPKKLIETWLRIAQWS